MWWHFCITQAAFIDDSFVTPKSLKYNISITDCFQIVYSGEVYD